MGTWSTSITGNDTALDLRLEYSIAFCYNDVPIALSKIDDYIRKEGFKKSDAGEWCDYYYSLADYMWSKGILTEEVKEEALHLIDSDFGLEIWEESGNKILEKRKQVLEKFRDKLTSPQPPKKKIKVDLNTQPIFEIGDVVALQLKTLDKPFVKPAKNNRWQHTISEEEFRNLNDKYIVIRKIADSVSFTSGVDSNIRDLWPIFQLYKGVFETVPTLEEVTSLEVATIRGEGYFCCAGSMYHFKRRKFAILGNYQENLVKSRGYESIDFGNKYDDLSLVSGIFTKNSMNATSISWCEMSYSKCFSKESHVYGGFRYEDQLIKDMYDHNFTLFFHSLSCEEMLLSINEEVEIRKMKGANYCNIVSFIKISEDVIKKFEIQPEITVLGFYEFDPSKLSSLQAIDDCVISVVSNEKMIEDALNLDLQEDEETLGVDFCTRRITRRKDTYLADRNYISKNSPYSYYGLNCYICYHKDEPAGKCDLFISSGCAKIENFQVATDKQRQGYGTTLLKYVIDVALSKKVHTIYLVTDEDDTAKEMYLKLGFYKVGERTDLLFRW